MGLAGVGIATSIMSLGYGIFAGQQAQDAQQRAVDAAKQNAQAQRAQEMQMYQDQQRQMKETQAANLAQEQKTQQETRAEQQKALAAEREAIGTNKATLMADLTQQSQNTMAKNDPFIQQRLNAMGILSGGALPAEEAKYQADLLSQEQSKLANFEMGAQGQLTQNTNAASANQVAQEEQNALLNIQNQEQNMSQGFANQNAQMQNQTAYDQYLTNLQMAKAQGQQGAANSYLNFGGGLAGGLMNYYGNNGGMNTPYGVNSSLDALVGWRQKGPTDYSIPMTYGFEG